MKYLPLVLLMLSACSNMPSPLNDPYVSSWEKRCDYHGTWSYVWIYERGKELQASADRCKK